MAGSPTVRDAVICEPLRTAVGGFGGVFRDVPPTELAATVIRELLRRTSLPPLEIDDVLLGQCYPNGEAPAIGRVAALDAGLSTEVPGLQLDRRCGSGLQAIMLGCMEVVAHKLDQPHSPGRWREHVVEPETLACCAHVT
jgi:acetyl-CoA C-acetyltransferase